MATTRKPTKPTTSSAPSGGVRIERDTMGELEVPAQAYYVAPTGADPLRGSRPRREIRIALV